MHDIVFHICENYSTGHWFLYIVKIKSICLLIKLLKYLCDICFIGNCPSLFHINDIDYSNFLSTQLFSKLLIQLPIQSLVPSVLSGTIYIFMFHICLDSREISWHIYVFFILLFFLEIQSSIWSKNLARFLEFIVVSSISVHSKVD